MVGSFILFDLFLDSRWPLIRFSDENGFCDNSTSTTGVEVVSAANFDMSLSIEGELDGDDHSFYNRKLVVWVHSSLS